MQFQYPKKMAIIYRLVIVRFRANLHDTCKTTMDLLMTKYTVPNDRKRIYKVALSVGFMTLTLLLAPGETFAELNQRYLDAWYQMELSATTDSLTELGAEASKLNDTINTLREQFDGAKKQGMKVSYLEDELAVKEKRVQIVQAAIVQVESKQRELAVMKEAATDRHIARAIRIKGDAFFVVEGEGEVKPLKKGIDLHAGHTLSTGPGGFLEIVATDGNTVQIGSDSVLTLQSMSQDESAIQLTRGRLHAQFRCVELEELACNNLNVHLGRFQLSGKQMEVNVTYTDQGEKRFYQYQGEAELKTELREDVIKMVAGTMVEVSAEDKIYGPMVMDFSWLPRWWD